METHPAKRGLTLIEALVSITIVASLVVGILGTFFISRLGAERAKHRIAAMNKLREYMEQEICAGYLGGSVDGDYYMTVSSSSTVNFTVDDRGTSGTSDDLVGTITPNPYPAPTATIGAFRYKTIGFVAQWNEDTSSTCRERVATHVAEHN